MDWYGRCLTHNFDYHWSLYSHWIDLHSKTWEALTDNFRHRINAFEFSNLLFVSNFAVEHAFWQDFNFENLIETNFAYWNFDNFEWMIDDFEQMSVKKFVVIFVTHFNNIAWFLILICVVSFPAVVFTFISLFSFLLFVRQVYVSFIFAFFKVTIVGLSRTI